MASDWNLFMDALLEQDGMTVAEYRLAVALARLLPGWRRTSAKLGRQHLRERARLDGRSFDRARTGLCERGLIAYEAGGPGRGNRSTYTLLLPGEKTAQERPFEGEEKAAPQRPKPESRKGRSGGMKKAAPQRPRIGSGRGKTNTPTRKTFQNLLADEYLGGGGNLELHDWRGSLFGQGATLRKKGVPDQEILDAAHSLGRERAFPGHLKRRVSELREQGGLCEWDGLNRSRLTTGQLTECGCNRCTEWANNQTTALVRRS